MQSDKPGLDKASKLRRLALSRWDDEGGAGPDGPQEGSSANPCGDMDIMQLHIRVIALENLMIAALAEGTENQRCLARAMADLISPQRGSTPHPLTIKAAAHMVDLIQRSQHFRDAPQ